MKYLNGAALVVACLALAGCGQSAAEVSGTVLLDGQPLKEGDIIFEEVDKSKSPAAAKIADGKYVVKMAPGMKTVKITASRPTRKIDPVMGSAAREQMIAKEFNEKTTLTAEVRAGTQEGVNFEVKAIP
jgi:hypothetical protein